jgi:hypothetical protein
LRFSPTGEKSGLGAVQMLGVERMLGVEVDRKCALIGKASSNYRNGTVDSVESRKRVMDPENWTGLWLIFGRATASW